MVSPFCTPPEVEFDAFGASKHKEGKIAIENFSLLYISVHRGDLIEQMKKKICHIHFKSNKPFGSQLQSSLRQTQAKFNLYKRLLLPLLLSPLLPRKPPNTYETNFLAERSPSFLFLKLSKCKLYCIQHNYVISV